MRKSERAIWERIFTGMVLVKRERLKEMSMSVDMSLKEDLDFVFTYHKPEGDDPERYEAIRAAAKELVRVIALNTPKCADQSAAFRHIREAVMTANASIALKGRV